MRHPAVHIEPAQGKLGILLVGLGSVSTTFIAGVLAIRQGLAAPVGSLTQLGILPSERDSPDDPAF
ncbi:MAG: inositol-3-phosphate synthase, partial [Sinobacteraceae bacterium]|nr:inositol-3-phosphate synthase [Nevskiaceae bacterium]